MQHTANLRWLGGRDKRVVGLSGEVAQDQILVLDSGQALSPCLVNMAGLSKKGEVFIVVRTKTRSGHAMIQVVSHVHRGVAASTLAILAIQNGETLV